MTDTTETHAAEWHEAEAEATYQRSHALSLDATKDAPGGRTVWTFMDTKNGWGAALWREATKSPGTLGITWAIEDFVPCPTREEARALATERNLPPPRLQSHSPESVPTSDAPVAPAD